MTSPSQQLTYFRPYLPPTINLCNVNIPPLLGIIFFEFDNILGPTVVAQYPDNILSPSTFRDYSDLVLSSSDFSCSVFTVHSITNTPVQPFPSSSTTSTDSTYSTSLLPASHQRQQSQISSQLSQYTQLPQQFRVITYPIVINADHYYRNSFFFAFGFIIGINGDATFYSSLIVEIGRWLYKLEVDKGMLQGQTERVVKEQKKEWARLTQNTSTILASPQSTTLGSSKPLNVTNTTSTKPLVPIESEIAANRNSTDDVGNNLAQEFIKPVEMSTQTVEQGDYHVQFNLGDIRDLAKAAEQGNADAQYNLGDMYLFGKDVDQDLAKAFELFTKSAVQDNADAQNSLGNMYLVGNGVDQDLTKAREWYQEAAKLGNANAQNSLGDMYRLGKGVRKDLAKAVEWYTKAAALGNDDAQYNLGNISLEDGNPTEAIKWFTKSYEGGNHRAQYALGNMYLVGNGVDQDLARAFEWFTKSENTDAQNALDIVDNDIDNLLELCTRVAEQNQYFPDGIHHPIHQNFSQSGNADAQNFLGNVYRLGKGVDKDLAKAAEWYTKSTEKGNHRAQYNLGDMYLFGKDVDQDLAKAFELFTKSAVQDNADAQNSLGDMYRLGQGVDQDLAKAIEWYQEAAKLGNADAQYNLGNIYLSGNHAEGTVYHIGKHAFKDPAKAAEWFTKSAEGGNHRAQYVLGDMYRLARGVNKDLAKAFELFTKSYEKGNPHARKALSELRKKSRTHAAISSQSESPSSSTMIQDINQDASLTEIVTSFFLLTRGSNINAGIPSSTSPTPTATALTSFRDNTELTQPISNFDPNTQLSNEEIKPTQSLLSVSSNPVPTQPQSISVSAVQQTPSSLQQITPSSAINHLALDCLPLRQHVLLLLCDLLLVQLPLTGKGTITTAYGHHLSIELPVVYPCFSYCVDYSLLKKRFLQQFSTLLTQLTASQGKLQHLINDAQHFQFIQQNQSHLQSQSQIQATTTRTTLSNEINTIEITVNELTKQLTKLISFIPTPCLFQAIKPSHIIDIENYLNSSLIHFTPSVAEAISLTQSQYSQLLQSFYQESLSSLTTPYSPYASNPVFVSLPPYLKSTPFFLHSTPVRISSRLRLPHTSTLQHQNHTLSTTFLSSFPNGLILTILDQIDDSSTILQLLRNTTTIHPYIFLTVLRLFINSGLVVLIDAVLTTNVYTFTPEWKAFVTNQLNSSLFALDPHDPSELLQCNNISGQPFHYCTIQQPLVAEISSLLSEHAETLSQNEFFAQSQFNETLCSENNKNINSCSSASTSYSYKQQCSFPICSILIKQALMYSTILPQSQFSSQSASSNPDTTHSQTHTSSGNKIYGLIQCAKALKFLLSFLHPQASEDLQSISKNLQSTPPFSQPAPVFSTSSSFHKQLPTLANLWSKNGIPNVDPIRFISFFAAFGVLKRVSIGIRLSPAQSTPVHQNALHASTQRSSHSSPHQEYQSHLFNQHQQCNSPSSYQNQHNSFLFDLILTTSTQMRSPTKKHHDTQTNANTIFNPTIANPSSHNMASDSSNDKNHTLDFKFILSQDVISQLDSHLARSNTQHTSLLPQFANFPNSLHSHGLQTSPNSIPNSTQQSTQTPFLSGNSTTLTSHTPRTPMFISTESTYPRLDQLSNRNHSITPNTLLQLQLKSSNICVAFNYANVVNLKPKNSHIAYYLPMLQPPSPSFYSSLSHHFTLHKFLVNFQQHFSSSLAKNLDFSILSTIFPTFQPQTLRYIQSSFFQSYNHLTLSQAPQQQDSNRHKNPSILDNFAKGQEENSNSSSSLQFLRFFAIFFIRPQHHSSDKYNPLKPQLVSHNSTQNRQTTSTMPDLIYTQRQSSTSSTSIPQIEATSHIDGDGNDSDIPPLEQNSSNVPSTVNAHQHALQKASADPILFSHTQSTPPNPSLPLSQPIQGTINRPTTSFTQNDIGTTLSSILSISDSNIDTNSTSDFSHQDGVDTFDVNIKNGQDNQKNTLHSNSHQINSYTPTLNSKLLNNRPTILTKQIAGNVHHGTTLFTPLTSQMPTPQLSRRPSLHKQTTAPPAFHGTPSFSSYGTGSNQPQSHYNQFYQQQNSPSLGSNSNPSSANSTQQSQFTAPTHATVQHTSSSQKNTHNNNTLPLSDTYPSSQHCLPSTIGNLYNHLADIFPFASHNAPQIASFNYTNAQTSSSPFYGTFQHISPSKSSVFHHTYTDLSLTLLTYPVAHLAELISQYRTLLTDICFILPNLLFDPTMLPPVRSSTNTTPITSPNSPSTQNVGNAPHFFSSQLAQQNNTVDNINLNTTVSFILPSHCEQVSTIHFYQQQLFDVITQLQFYLSPLSHQPLDLYELSQSLELSCLQFYHLLLQLFMPNMTWVYRVMNLLYQCMELISSSSSLPNNGFIGDSVESVNSNKTTFEKTIDSFRFLLLSIHSFESDGIRINDDNNSDLLFLPIELVLF